MTDKFVTVGQTDAQQGTAVYTKLTVHLDSGKRGYNVGLARHDDSDKHGKGNPGAARQYQVPTIQTADGTTLTCAYTAQTETEARAHFAALVAAVKAGGWQERVRRPRLSGIPAATTAAPTVEQAAPATITVDPDEHAALPDAYGIGPDAELATTDTGKGKGKGKGRK